MLGIGNFMRSAVLAFVPRGGYSASAQADGITYDFVGRELGWKPDDPALHAIHGLPDYDAIAATSLYHEVIMRIEHLAHERRAAFTPSCAARAIQRSVTASG
jgi:hypothetical protein